MSRPKIIKETKRAIEERAPPVATSVEPHPWLSEDSLSMYREVLRSGKAFDAYLSRLAEEKIRKHAEKDAPKRLEVMGFMLGEVRTWEGLTYTLVKDVATTKLRSSPSKVRFDPEAFPKLFHGLDELAFDYVLVGWYHSHPGHTCFLSNTDMDTQRAMFGEPYHIALVIDPVNREVKTFKLRRDGYEEVPFAVFSASRNAAERGKSSRKRRLKITPATSQE